jgi:hypothetical protein
MRAEGNSWIVNMPTEVRCIPESEGVTPIPAVLAVPASQAVSQGKITPAASSVLDAPQAKAVDPVAAVAAPFADFVGRCFLRACLWFDLLGEWISQKQPPARIESETLDAVSRNEIHGRKYDWHSAGWLRSSLGAVACAIAAGTLVGIFWSSSFRSLVPFIFLTVISYVALRFGDKAGLIGTAIAALLFASVLFEPRPSLAISNPVERDHLIVMVVLGLCASEFLGRRKTHTEYKPWC